jgi:hypothetical protein
MQRQSEEEMEQIESDMWDEDQGFMWRALLLCWGDKFFSNKLQLSLSRTHALTQHTSLSLKKNQGYWQKQLEDTREKTQPFWRVQEYMQKNLSHGSILHGWPIHFVQLELIVESGAIPQAIRTQYLIVFYR